MKIVNEVKVIYKDRVVGYISQFGQLTVFSYDFDWLKDGFSISPIVLPLSDKKYVSKNSLGISLHGVFFDCLPDGWGFVLLKKFLRQQDIDLDHVNEVTLLTLLSKNGYGALEFVPTQFLENSEDIDLVLIEQEISNVLKDIETRYLNYLISKGSSTGGSRPKVYATIDNEDYIIKFAGPNDPINIGEQEYKINQLAIKCGLNVNKCKLFEVNGKKVFGAIRFDRVNKEKIHCISLAGLLDIDFKTTLLDYRHLFQVVSLLCPVDLEEAYRRLVFNYLIENKDDHPKNFSFYYDEINKTYRLAPAYDLTRTIDLVEHQMGVNYKGNATKKEIIEFGISFNLSKKFCVDTYEFIEKQVELSGIKK